jgi:hypothetical protein
MSRFRAEMKVAAVIEPATVACATAPSRRATASRDDGNSYRLPARTRMRAGVGISGSLAGTAAGDLVVVAVYLNDSVVTGVTDNASSGTSSYSAISAAKTENASDEDYVELWATTDADGGADSLDVYSSPQTISAIVAWDVAVLAPAQLDTAAASQNQPATANPVSPAITTTVSGEIVVAVGVPVADILGVHAGSPFVDDQMTFADGYAHLSDPAAAPACIRPSGMLMRPRRTVRTLRRFSSDPEASHRVRLATRWIAGLRLAASRLWTHACVFGFDHRAAVAKLGGG